jgi:hypothetical protein
MPFQGSLQTAKQEKQTESLKGYIDETFSQHFRYDSLNDQQETFDKSSESWVECENNEQHVLRFLMQWMLVRHPLARKHALRFYSRLLGDTSVILLLHMRFYLFDYSSAQIRAKTCFTAQGDWDIEWDTFGHPRRRFEIFKDLSDEDIER